MSGKILEEEGKMLKIERQEDAGNQKIAGHQVKPEKQNGDRDQIILEKDDIKEDDLKKDIKDEIKKDMKKEIKEAPVPAWRRGKQEVITQNFPIFMGVALAFGILYTFCMYKNPSGITYPIMVGGIYGVLAWMLRRLSVEWKRGSWFLIVTAVLLGIAVCRTADPLLILLIKTAEFLLVVIFVIHQFYEDREWSIGKYLSSMAVYLCCVIAAVVYPFFQGNEFFKKVNLKKYRTASRVLMGLAAALPILLVAGFLLGRADVVFGSMVVHWMETVLNVWTILIMVSMTAFGAFGVYCLICGACMDQISGEEKTMRTHEPVTAITCMSAVALLYLFFSGIQVIYLFLGKGSLPEGVTYSSYARQGFFQLLFVAVMNLVMVLMNLKFFKRSRFLNGVLTVICGCTYVMIASAAYRMALYVGEYHLTYLRVLVLWFLLLLACMMAGVVILIYRNRFPLFGWCLVMVSVFFVGFSYMRPDRVIADYNAAHVSEWSDSDFTYMTQALSADAVPVVLETLEDNAVLGRFYSGGRTEFLTEYYRWVISKNYQVGAADFRTWNLSFEKAKQSFRNGGIE